MKKDYVVLIWGIIIVAVGIIFTGNVLNLWYIDIFFRGWWTLFLIVPALVSILKSGFNWGAATVATIGLILLLDSQNIFSAKILWKLIFPLVIVAFGVSLITSFFRGNNDGNKRDEEN